MFVFNMLNLLPKLTNSVGPSYDIQRVSNNHNCSHLHHFSNAYLTEKYIIQIARFDPAKGIPDVIEAYVEFRRLLTKKSPIADAPQLVM